MVELPYGGPDEEGDDEKVSTVDPLTEVLPDAVTVMEAEEEMGELGEVTPDVGCDDDPESEVREADAEIVSVLELEMMVP